MAEYISCSQCGREFPTDFNLPDSVAYTYFNNEVWCSDCVNKGIEDGKIVSCDACGVNMLAEDAIPVDNSCQFERICEDCFTSDDFFECSSCHRVLAWGESYAGDLNLDPSRPICYSCVDDGLVHYCRSCGTLVDNHHEYCDLHNSSGQGRVYSYKEAHNISYPSDRFCLAKGESSLTTRCCGFELEFVDDRFINLTPQEKYDLDNYDIDASCNKLLKAFKENDLLKYASITKDGTVTGEVITVPMSIEWLYSAEGYAVFKKLLDTMAVNDCMAEMSIENRVFDTDSNTDTLFRVGGHIHVSSLCRSTPPEYGGQLASFLATAKEFWKAVSGRDLCDIAFDFCKFGDAYPHTSGLACHGYAVNLYHPKTIELRFWSGCLTADLLRARAVISCALVEFFATVYHRSSRRSRYIYQENDAKKVLKQFLSYLKNDYPHGEDGYWYFTLGLGSPIVKEVLGEPVDRVGLRVNEKKY
jgi:hypothetical protein